MDRDSLASLLERFIARWDGTERAERANYQMFLQELCDVLDVPRPDPAQGSGGDYRFERGVTRHHADGVTSARRIDLYKRGCFVLEAKQATNAPKQPTLFGPAEAQRRADVRHSKGWSEAMLKAKGQAEGYARDLDDEWPPFLIVADIGFCFDLHADFSGKRKHYDQFPDRNSFRIFMSDLRDPAIRARLRAVWLDPHSLDPTRQRTQVTREIAELLARLARALERQGHRPTKVATFLMRCIFSMFAQSVGLLPSQESFTDLLEDCRPNLPGFVPRVGELWRQMNNGGFSVAVNATVRRFNGGLFAPGPDGAVEPLPLDADMLNLLIAASRRDWAHVEPAIFGTLLERALDAEKRGQLGAHFTPRAFVERLVQPTIMEPLRAEWDSAKAAALDYIASGEREAAAKAVRAFHARLCAVRVLDPACGSGNFLYVTLELMKRLEGEVLDLLTDLQPGEGDRLQLAGASVDPHQFLGLEKNERAVPVAELVLWIGWLQWHFRTRGSTPPAEPILRDFHNIREADALLTYAKEEPEHDAHGHPVTRWGGRTRLHPVTGEAVPDESDRVPVLRPVNPKPTVWPEADFIVGNPPFIAGKDLRAELGSGYAEALWAAYPKVPKSADIALHFWWKAAQALRGVRPRGRRPGGKSAPPPVSARRFGFITSNSLRQVFCRRVVADALESKPPLHLAFAIPDHPWVDGAGTAAVRIAMSVVELGTGSGRLAIAAQELPGMDGVPDVRLRMIEGRINADLTIGTDVKAARPLRANQGLSSPGVKLHGAGFIVSPQTARALGLGRVSGLERHIRPYLNGRDLLHHSRGELVIDLFGLTEADVRRRFPAVYQHVLTHVKPERDQNNRTAYRTHWWIFGEPRKDLRPALVGLPRYVGTVETAKHRIFIFIDSTIIPDNMVIAFGLCYPYYLGVLQSKAHLRFSLAAGGTLEDRPRYNKTQTFDPFPFPAATPTQRAEIGAIAEELDALRKARQAAHPHLTLTGMYNVLAALRENRALTPAERDIHDAGHVSVLRALHDRLDAAVDAAYGWPADLSDAEIVARLVALNAERVAEEARGLVRWLRPEFQAPQEVRPVQRQAALDIVAQDAPLSGEMPAWPRDRAEQFLRLRSCISTGPVAPADIARRFKDAPPRARLASMLAVLADLGLAREQGGRYSA